MNHGKPGGTNGQSEVRDRMESIYRTLPAEEIPWNFETPPEFLIRLAVSGAIEPCTTIDLGCGTGTNALYFARRGHDVTGVDISPTAIALARKKALEMEIDCRFIVDDVLGGLESVRSEFDFVYDWELLHHIFPPNRELYISNVLKVLNPEGRYLSVSFSEESPQFGGEGKYRTTPLGTVLYFSSEAEIRSLLEPSFAIDNLETIEIEGKRGPHKAVCALAVRKQE